MAAPAPAPPFCKPGWEGPRLPGSSLFRPQGGQGGGAARPVKCAPPGRIRRPLRYRTIGIPVRRPRPAAKGRVGVIPREPPSPGGLRRSLRGITSLNPPPGPHLIETRRPEAAEGVLWLQYIAEPGIDRRRPHDAYQYPNAKPAPRQSAPGKPRLSHQRGQQQHLLRLVVYPLEIR